MVLATWACMKPFHFYDIKKIHPTRYDPAVDYNNRSNALDSDWSVSCDGGLVHEPLLDKDATTAGRLSVLGLPSINFIVMNI